MLTWNECNWPCFPCLRSQDLQCFRVSNQREPDDVGAVIYPLIEPATYRAPRCIGYPKIEEEGIDKHSCKIVENHALVTCVGRYGLTEEPRGCRQI